MAEYSKEELMKMQQEAMRRVNEMNERARRSLNKTPAPQFERAPAPTTKDGQAGAKPQFHSSEMANNGGNPMPVRQPKTQLQSHMSVPGETHPSGGHPVKTMNSSVASGRPAAPSGIARFFNLRQIFKDADTPLILAVLLLLYTENDDPLLMMALVYIML